MVDIMWGRKLQYEVMEQAPASTELVNGKHKPKQKKTAESVQDNDVFTTGDVALICRISQQAVIRCFEMPDGTEGKLKGFRVPGSRHRRIVRRELEKFMQNCGMPMEWLTGKTEENEISSNDQRPESI